MTRLEELIQALPPDLQQKVEEYARSLVPDQREKQQGRLTLGWAGMLKDAWPGKSSVEVQHEILKEWEAMAMDGVSPEPEDV